MGTPEPAPPLALDDAIRLTDFARACKAAARAVVLYPDGHPAIGTTLGRLVQITSAASLQAPLRIQVRADALLIDGRAPARPDASLAELAALLHARLIGEMTVLPDGDQGAWHSFLRLLGRPPEEMRAEGGIARLWTTMAGRHVEIREIDYSEVLRERAGRLPAGWEDVVAICLQGGARAFDDRAIGMLAEIARDSGRLTELLAAADASAIESGHGGSRPDVLLRLLGGLLGSLDQHDAAERAPALSSVAEAVCRLSPETLLGLLGAAGGDTAGVMDTVVSHMSDDVKAQFVARHAMSDSSSIDRVAQAFQALVRDPGDQERLVALAHEEAAASPLGRLERFEQTWGQVAEKLLTSYSDEPFVSDDYARELSATRTRALRVEQLGDDPPQRLAEWLGSVTTNELRQLDLRLVLDLLRLEQDSERRATLVTPVAMLAEDLVLVGDFDATETLIAAVTASPPDTDTMASAIRSRLVSGPLLSHVVSHLPTLDDTSFAKVRALCLSLGEGLIGPLAETLAAEDRTRPRERMTAILIGFGAIGRREVERLKNSANPAVRRAAVYLLREFGGREALPELTELLKDSEPQVQREAVRAILNIGTDRAYAVLEQALTQGSAVSRDAIMQTLGAVRDEQAAPLFAYILRKVDHRGPLRPVYLRAIETLGTLKDPAGVPALTEALTRGEWWAPRRTAALRAAAASALVRLGGPEAEAALDTLLEAGSRGVRAAVRAARHGGAR